MGGQVLRNITAMLLLTLALGASAEELRWGFASADGMPYVEVHEQELRGGFIYRLGNAASQRLGVPARFVETPNKRIEEFMLRGRIHVICNANPQWINEPQRFHWSPPLYSEEDVLLTHSQQPAIQSLEDLYGKVLGTQLGYVYSTPLMQAFAEQRITRQDVRDLNASINLLSHQRLDAVIDMRRPISFQLARHPDAPLRISPWIIERYDMHCSYSPQLPVDAARLDQALLELREQGQIELMLATP